MDLNTCLNAGGTDLPAIIAETDDGRLYLELTTDNDIQTHRIVPIDVWRRMFDEYIECRQLALRRGIEIDRMRRAGGAG